MRDGHAPEAVPVPQCWPCEPDEHHHLFRIEPCARVFWSWVPFVLDSRVNTPVHNESKDV